MGFWNKTEFKLFLSIAVIYFIFIHWVGDNEWSRFALTQAIVDEGKFQLDSYANTTGDRAYFNGHYYSDKAPGTAFLSIPFYLLAKNLLPNNSISDEMTVTDKTNNIIFNPQPSPALKLTSVLSTFVFSSLLTIATAYLLYRLSFDFFKEKRLRYLVPVIYALGSLAFPNALIFYGHAAATFFTFSAFYIFYYTGKKFKDQKYQLFAGLMAGTAFLIEYTTLIITIGIILAYFISRKITYLPTFSLGFLVLFSVVLIYNQVNFGDPLNFSYIGLEWTSERLASQVDLSYINTKLSTEIKLGDLSKKEEFSRLFSILNLNPTFYDYHIQTITRILFFPERGLLFYSPIFVISLIGLAYMFKTNKLFAALILFFFLSFLWFLSTPYLPWWGGASFGMRHLNLIVPFLVFAMFFVLKRINYKIILSLLIVSLIINVIGLQPPEDLGIKFVFMSDSYLTTVKNFIPLANPLLDYYWPKFLESGPHSPILNNAIRGILDIRDFTLLRISVLKVSELSNGILTLSVKLLPLTILFGTLLIFWFKKIPTNNLKILLPFIFVMLVLSLFRINQVTYDTGWYNDDQSPKFMKNSATISIFSQESVDKRLAINVYPYLSQRDLQIFFSDELIETTNLIDKTTITTPEISLKKGTNQISLFSQATCNVPYYIDGSVDYRCLTFGIYNVSVVNTENLEGKTIFDFGWSNESKLWSSNFSKIYYFSPYKGKALINMSIESFFKPQKISITVNNISLFTDMVGIDKENIKLQFDAEKGENTIYFISDRCTVPRDVTNFDDRRCLSFVISDFKISSTASEFENRVNYAYSTDWYLEEFANNTLYRWMNGSGEIKTNSINEQFGSISFVAKSYYKPKILDILVDSKLLSTQNLDINWSKISFSSVPFKIRSIITFKTTESCHVPFEIESVQDYRCVSVAIGNLSVESNRDLFEKISNISYASGWHGFEMDVTNKSYNWMSENAELILSNSEPEFLKLSLFTWSFEKNRTLEVLIDNVSVASYDIPTYETKITTPVIYLTKGVHKTLLVSKEGCSYAVEDNRCLSFALGSVYGETANKPLEFVEERDNWFAKEYLGSKILRWSTDGAEIELYKTGATGSIILNFTAQSYHNYKNLTISVNGNPQFNLLVSPENLQKIFATIVLQTGENVISFTTKEACNYPNIIEKSSDNRCLNTVFKEFELYGD